MKKRSAFAIVLGLIVMFCVACGSVASEESFDYGKSSVGLFETATADEGAYSYTDDYSYDDSYIDNSYSETTSTENVDDIDLSDYDMSRKLIYSSYISLETKNFDTDISKVKELVTSNGGYFENSSTYGNVEYGNRSASYTVRIPADNYDTFMNSVGTVGSLVSKNESVDDITSSYVDVQARLKSLETKLERLQELEQQATSVDELLDIEDRINEVQYQIESYTAQKKTYDDKVDYSTVSIDVSEVVTYSEIKADTALNRFAEAFSDSFAGFITFLQNVVIMLIYILPYIIVIGIILFIIFKVRKKSGTKRLFRSKKKEKENDN